MGNLLDKQGMPVMIGRVVREMMFEKINKSLDNVCTRKEVRTNNIQAKIDMTQKKPVNIDCVEIPGIVLTGCN